MMINLMRFIPLSIVVFLPAKMREKYVTAVWCAKSDHRIQTAYNDRMSWVEMGKPCRYLPPLPTAVKIAAECQRDLDKHIIPQMKRRGMSLMERSDDV